jgi:hypothetical protein
MDLKEIVTLLGNWGAMGVLLAVLLWERSKLEGKLLDIVQANTKAFEELKSMIEKCQLTHKN